MNNNKYFARQQTNKTNADNVIAYKNVGICPYFPGTTRSSVYDLVCTFILCIYNLYIFVRSLPKYFVKNIKIRQMVLGLN